MISSVTSMASESFPGAYTQSSPEVSNIKAFSTATSSFDVWVVEDKFAG
jgi:hypothetical protein